MAIEYSFSGRLALSQGQSTGRDIAEILRKQIPGALAAYPAQPGCDRAGTDYWVEHVRGAHLSVDVKVRTEDWAVKPEPDRADDLALETWSVVGKKVGWTRDSTKRTDYILWLWIGTGRWCLVPFAMLCAVFQENWQAWAACYGTHQQRTPEHGGYFSECVFVPRDVVWDAIYHRYAGTPSGVLTMSTKANSISHSN